MRLAWFMAAVSTSIVLNGCVAYQADDLGTQRGYVRRIYPVGIVPSDHPECLVTLNDSQRSAGRYVQIEFTKVDGKRYVNSFIGTEVDLNLNEDVWVSSPYCIGSHKPAFISKKN